VLILVHAVSFQEVGCDHILHSGKAKDRCGICNGNGDPCTLVQSSYSNKTSTGIILNRSFSFVVVVFLRVFLFSSSSLFTFSSF